MKFRWLVLLCLLFASHSGAQNMISGGVVSGTQVLDQPGSPLVATVTAIPNEGTEPLLWNVTYTVQNASGNFAVCTYCHCPIEGSCSGTPTESACSGVPEAYEENVETNTYLSLCQGEDGTFTTRIEVEDGL